VLGRASRFLPEGFESTGITTFIAIYNVGIISGNFIAVAEIDTYNV
jgi:hypothetical protein